MSDGVREFSPKTLHISPLTGTPYEVINEFTYDYLDPEIKELYRINQSGITYSYYGRATEKKDD